MKRKSYRNLERLVDWDVRISDGPIDYFDPNLSYEATGYRPINDTRGLEFDPKWFTEAAAVKKETGKYSPWKYGSKMHRDFWTEQGWRCREGFTINGYTITGDNYYFLNFYRLPSVDVEIAGQGRPMVFPDFYVEQYKYFHYVQLCRFYGFDGITLKSRGIGWSEVNACMEANTYTWRQNSTSLIACYALNYLEDSIKKVFDQMDYNNSDTEGGMRRLRQVKDQAMRRRSSRIEYVDGQKIERGMMSEVYGIVADEPRKIRGKRVENLIMDEFGSWGNSQKAFTQAKELVIVQGKRIGNIFAFGTGGDSGPNLAGLAEIFNNPADFGVLGYRHNHTKSGDICITGFFVPAWSIIRELMDERGYVNEEEGKAFRQKHDRDPLQGNPKQLLIKCAEQCWYPEEALALEGDERFNTVLLTEQKSRIVTLKQTPDEYKPKYGILEYRFSGGVVDEKNIEGIDFIENPKFGPMNGVCIIEPPQRPEKSGEVYNNLYVAGIDGIDFGGEDTSESNTNLFKFCIVIKKRMQGLKDPMYVAYYMGRHERVKDDYVQALRLIQYYNAKAMIEKTRIGFLSFMDGKRLKYKYMMRRPKSTESDKGTHSSQNNNFGAPASEMAIQHGLTLVAEFVEEYCHTIWIPEVIDQLITYSYEKKREFDIVAAMQMAELADEELSSTPITVANDYMQKREEVQFVYGYYTDERGYRRRGKIPMKKKPQVTYNEDLENDMIYGDGRIYTSNPMYNEFM